MVVAGTICSLCHRKESGTLHYASSWLYSRLEKGKAKKAWDAGRQMIGKVGGQARGFVAASNSGSNDHT